MIWLYGYGWPIYRGGPMHLRRPASASSTSPTGCRSMPGKPTIPSLEPAPLLKHLAAEGKTFGSLAQTAKAA